MHLTEASQARSYMRSQIEDSKKALEAAFKDSIPPLGSCLPPCSQTITVHFSFDFAQQVGGVHTASSTKKNYHVHVVQVHYPHSPQQPGPIYFLTPRKCGIFGVVSEAIPRQASY